MNERSQSITLNIPYDLADAAWEALVAVYKKMPGWVDAWDADGCPTWRPSGTAAENITASIEPSGLLIEGSVSPNDWSHWIEEFQQRATAALGFRVQDAEE
jgi:hypothetical protein